MLCAEIQAWAQIEDTTGQCHLAALTAWDKFEETGKEFRSFIKIIQSSGAFTDFSYLQRLVSAVNKNISDPEAKQMLVETLAFENVNTEC